jgi:hypothetical protein
MNYSPGAFPGRHFPPTWLKEIHPDTYASFSKLHSQQQLECINYVECIGVGKLHF